ncbi:calcium-binding protein [Ancylobacter lacus]|uniref:calcium-binding protein n=1 Tax=Ancylobacter lacus TaxID=2579970 RepID=UPI001BCDC9C0|nr:calcium-binding protein [Ancylobacter lacus]MBS7540581.1 calcium-binding protein [Ancylobacter lacus]
MEFTRSGKFNRTSTTTNTTTNETLSTYGFYGSALIYTATSTDKTLNGSDENEAFIYDLTLNGTNALRFSGFTDFNAGGGDDIMDFTVRPANVGKEYATTAKVSGGLGNDVIWTAGAKLTIVYGDYQTMSGSSSTDMVQGGNDIIDLSAATAATTTYGDGATLNWAKGGNDTITGTKAGEYLYGDGGMATLANATATGGDDIIYGKAGADNIYGEGVGLANISGATGATAIGGNDILYAYDATTIGTDADNIYGDAANMAVQSSTTVIGGNDGIYGSNGGNMLYGDGTTVASGTDSTFTGGADTIYGRGGGDSIYGDGFSGATASGSKATGGNDILYGDDGDDAIYGDFSNVGHLTLSSTASGGNDSLYGGAGADSLVGDAGGTRAGLTMTCGNDRLDGGAGNDQLYGDISTTASGTITGGNDTFVFQPGSGADTIFDFGQSAGSATGDDLIDVSAYGYTSFADLTISNNGTATVTVTFSGSNSVKVQNKANTALTLDASDFIFAA